MAEKNLHENTDRLLVRAKPIFLKRIMDNLSEAQRQWVLETGFEKNVLDLPKGELLFENSHNTEYTDVWRSQFKDYMYDHKIFAEVICDALKSSELINLEFKLNFLIVLANVPIRVP
ncbi:hypothetical protein DCAR_0312398 [Daucus carota subsp. sativus]|uniref:Uncharacterized protein n=1 Tax=Daucus carota subsp. sativus TaxID=79200 RepID=A0A161XZC3_DAUCS|nr:hypothetical protein DCAR_0312398 [Daucus carota subsp. sativus]